MDKAEQPTITQAAYTVADYELAEQCVSAANVVTCDGHYEVDIEKVAETLARHRTTSLAAQDGLVEALEKIPTAALYALRHRQQQADMDGTFVTISRQALEEVLDAVEAALSAPSPPAQDGLVEALEWISKICDEEIPLEYNDAMRKAFQRNIRDAANKALADALENQP